MKILLFSLLLTNLMGKKNNILEIEKEILLDTKCTQKFVQQFIPDSSIEKVVESSPLVKEVCPTLEYSCCSEEDIREKSTIIFNKVKSLKQFVSDLEILLNKIEKLGERGLNKLFNMGTEKKCLSSNKTTLKQSFDFIKQNKIEIIETTKIAKEYISQRTASFLCELCRPEMDLNTLLLRSDRPTLLVNNNYCKQFFTNKFGYKSYKFLYFMNFIEPFTTVLSCIHGSSLALSPIFSEEEWKTKSNEFFKCRDEFEKRPLVITPNCINKCKFMSPLNKNLLATISSSISWTVLYLDFLVETSTFNSCTDITDENRKDFADNSTCQYNQTIPPDLKSKIAEIEYFKYYMTPNKEINKDLITDLEWRMSKNEGLDMEKNLMKEFRKSARVMSGFLLVSCLLLFLN